MKYIELFCGIGGFRYGLEQASTNSKPNNNNNNEEQFRLDKRDSSFKCVWANDIDKYACQVYRYRFGTGELYEGDIRTVDAATIPDHDLIVGGFPCQSFSIAGKRGGFEDTRGTLFFEICRIARAKRTKYLFLENVKGLLNHNQGKTFETIIRTLDELGYDCEWQVLNSKFHGVPQNRERVFIIGHLRGERRFQVFPIGETNGTYNESYERGSEEAPTGYCVQSEYRYPQSTSRDTRVNTTFNENTVSIVEDFYPDRIRTFEDSPTLRGDRQGLKLIHNVYGGFGETEPRVFEDISPTIRTPKGGGHLPMVANTVRTGSKGSPIDSKQCWDTYRINGTIRRLTPVECERLQGFPDNWTKYGIDKNGKEVLISDSQRYKMCGNAVTTNVITEIGKRLAQGVLL